MYTPTHRADVIHTPWSIGTHYRRMLDREAGVRPYPRRYGSTSKEQP